MEPTDGTCFARDHRPIENESTAKLAFANLSTVAQNLDTFLSVDLFSRAQRASWNKFRKKMAQMPCNCESFFAQNSGLDRVLA